MYIYMYMYICMYISIYIFIYTCQHLYIWYAYYIRYTLDRNNCMADTESRQFGQFKIYLTGTLIFNLNFSLKI